MNSMLLQATFLSGGVLLVFWVGIIFQRQTCGGARHPESRKEASGYLETGRGRKRPHKQSSKTNDTGGENMYLHHM